MLHLFHALILCCFVSWYSVLCVHFYIVFITESFYFDNPNYFAVLLFICDVYV
jgi:hypothetical protein